MDSLCEEVECHFQTIFDESFSGFEELSEEEEVDSTSKSSYQKESLFNAFLPYADKLNDEADTLFAKIKANLGRSVMLRKIKPDCIGWVDMLNKYVILYDFRFTKEDHIALVKLMYELVTIPNLESTLVATFGYPLYMLLRRSDLISPKELELPWKPLYDLFKHVTFPSQISLYRHSDTLPELIESIVYVAKIYFPTNATQEMLDELRPMICPLQLYIMQKVMKTIQLFLPVQLSPENHSLGHELWFNEFMILWKTRSHVWGSHLMHIMSQLAYHNIGYINWEPYVPLMFTKFVQSLKLPIGYKKISYSNNYELNTYCIGVWIASTLGGKSSTQIYLDKFLKTIETYFHPANHGSWLENISELFANISHYVVSRLHRERYQLKSTWKTSIPESHKLTDTEIDAFVKSMLPIAMIGIFNDNCPLIFYNALHDLSNMRPNIVIPKVLEKIHPTMGQSGSDIEPHKFITAMTCLINIARPFIRGSRIPNKEYGFQEGPLQVLPLLFAALSGIDPNDPDKVFITFRLIATCVTMIPIVDCSKSTVEMSEDDRLVCEETSRFEDFVLQFMDKVFIWIDSSSVETVRLENHTSEKSESEDMAETALSRVFSSLLRQTSSSIFSSALNKLKSFIVEHVLETQVAGQLVAILCKVFGSVNAHETQKALLPFLAEKVLDAIGEDEDVIKAENLNNQLMYPLLLLGQLVQTQGDALLPHMDTLIKVIDKVIRLELPEENRLGCFMLCNVLQSLSSVSFINIERNNDDPNYPYIKDWGETIKIKSAKVKTFVPGKEEFLALQKIFTRYFTPAVSILENFIKDHKLVTKDELQISLRTILNILDGCDEALPFWKEPPLQIESFENHSYQFEPITSFLGELKMPDGGNVRYFLVQIMTKLQKVMLENVEDDTESLDSLHLTWLNLLFGEFSMTMDPDFKISISDCIPKEVVESKMTGSNGWFPLLVLGHVDAHHRIRQRCYTSLLTKTHMDILMNLLVLSTNRYSGIRSDAQDTVLNALDYFPNAYKIVVPYILELLQKDPTTQHEAYKSALYLITDYIKTEPFEESLLIKQDWELIEKLWPALVTSKPSEKPSVIQLKDDIIDVNLEEFFTPNIELKIPKSCISIASNLWAVGLHPSTPLPTDQEIETGLDLLRKCGENNSRIYDSILKKLLSALLEKNLHWRHRLMAMHFILALVHPEQVFSPKIVRFFLNALIHESVKEREIALKVLVHVLKKLKKEPKKVKVEIPSKCENSSQKIQPGCRSDNEWLQYKYETRPTSSKAWDESHFVHPFYTGYYVWPRELLVHAPASQHPNLDKNLYTEQDHEFCKFFIEQQNVDKLVKFLSLEGKKGSDSFCQNRMYFFKGLFRNYNVTFLDKFLPHLERLVVDKQESSQRCAAEIIAGLIKGSKYWPYEVTESMWSSLLPILRSALSNFTNETVSDWFYCITYVCTNRDPKSIHWLLECLMEESPLGNSEASFLESGRLRMLQTALCQQSWKTNELLHRLLRRFEDRFEHSPFQNVRNCLASSLVVISEVNFKFGETSTGPEYLNVGNFLNKMLPRLLSLIEKDNVSPKLPIAAENMEVDSPNRNSSQQTSSPKTVDLQREKNIRLLKSVCKWIQETVLNTNLSSLSYFYKVYPIICQLEAYENDEELSTACTKSIAFLAKTLTHPEHIPAVLEAVRKVSESSFWTARTSCLEFLQVFTFHNMSVLVSNEDWIRTIQSIVLKLLEDGRLEVREKAAQVLSGLLHCTIILEQDTLLEMFKKKAETKISKKRKKPSDEEDELAENSKVLNAARSRHTGILGMCAFIQAHPYDVPKHVPPIFECLSSHLNDPEPIPSAIRKTFNEFKRTHCDGWTGLQGLAEFFTEQQFAILQDLTVPPSYYA